MTDIDREKHEIITKTGKRIAYDAVIMALGQETNYFNIEGLKEFSYGIKTIDDAEKLKNHLHKQIIETNEPDINYVIVGAGPTGIELAGVLPEYIKKILKHHNISKYNFHVDLIEAAPRLLPRASKATSKKVGKRLKKIGIKVYLNSAVQAETADSLLVKGKPIRSHTVIWTAGVSNNPFFKDHMFQMSKNGKVRVDQYLQAEPGIYVIGDNADTPYSGMAQTAIHDADFIATNLIRVANKKSPHPYFAKAPIFVYSVGRQWAALIWGSYSVYGRIGAWLKNLSFLVGYHDFEPWKQATSRFIDEYENSESCPVCATSIQE
jgi:NADH dehydrogenase